MLRVVELLIWPKSHGSIAGHWFIRRWHCRWLSHRPDSKEPKQSHPDQGGIKATFLGKPSKVSASPDQ